MMYVANHQSYMDVVLLSSFLPPGTRYIGKASLFKAPFLKTFLKKLKHISVEKDSSKALENMDAISNELKKGNSVFFFPEGTFSYATGLRPFKLGAFKIAAETNVPVCPIAIQGTRYVLRGNELLFSIS